MFYPMKPFQTELNLIINRKKGGKWRYKLKLEAYAPEVDDNITI